MIIPKQTKMLGRSNTYHFNNSAQCGVSIFFFQYVKNNNTAFIIKTNKQTVQHITAVRLLPLHNKKEGVYLKERLQSLWCA